MNSYPEIGDIVMFNPTSGNRMTGVVTELNMVTAMGKVCWLYGAVGSWRATNYSLEYTLDQIIFLKNNIERFMNEQP